jgi:hypothetical protein
MSPNQLAVSDDADDGFRSNGKDRPDPWFRILPFAIGAIHDGDSPFAHRFGGFDDGPALSLEQRRLAAGSVKAIC